MDLRRSAGAFLLLLYPSQEVKCSSSSGVFWEVFGCGEELKGTYLWIRESF